MNNNLNKTKRKIISTFLIFYIEKTLEQISIKSITEFCKLNRGTFYLHYFDLNDLLTSIEDEHLQNIGSINKKNLSLYESNIVSELEIFFIDIFNYLYTNRAVIKALIGPNSRPRFKESFKDIIRNHIKHSYRSIFINTEESELQKKEFIIESIVTGHMEIITKWIGTYNNISIREISNLISYTLLTSPYTALINA